MSGAPGKEGSQGPGGRPTGEVGVPEVEGIISALGEALGRVAPEALSGAEAARLMEALARGERLCAAGKTVAARVVERSGAWRRGGHRSAAHWMAAATGVAVGQAVGALQAARALEHLPATARAYRAGELSEPVVREVAAAASAVPPAEGDLLRAARTETVASLREACRRVVAQAATDQEEAHRRIHRGRYLRRWTDPDGAFRMDVRTTPDEGAWIVAGMEPHRRRIFAQARGDGRREPAQAYAADALVALARGEGSSCTGPGPGAVIHVRVDRAALLRGRTERGEVCEIPGIGPIPTSAARALCTDATVKAVITDGADVLDVVTVGRRIPAPVRAALQDRDPTCVVPGCDARVGLEIDHRVPFALGGPTTVDNLARLCRWHHRLKTHHGYRLGGSPGRWTWSGPDPPELPP